MKREDFDALLQTVGMVGLAETPTGANVKLTLKKGPWMLADGRYIPFKANPELFAAIGIYYGIDTVKGRFKISNDMEAALEDIKNKKPYVTVSFMRADNSGPQHSIGAIIHIVLWPERTELV